MHLLILPVETLELIIFHIPNTRDLFALALTTRALSDLIVPFHLQFRRIRCLTNTSTLWFNLRKHPDICMKIREIELYDGDDAAALHLPRRLHIPQPLLDMDTDPAILWPPTAAVIWKKSLVGNEPGSLPTRVMRLGMHEFISSFKRAKSARNQYACFSKESLLAFCGALPLLTNLTRFSLKNLTYERSIGADLLRTTLTAVVRSNHGLRELAIIWKTMTSSIDSNTFVSLWELSDLTSFELSVDITSRSMIYRSQCTDMLVKRCPDLNNLSLDNAPDKPWETANWKQLRRLSVVNLETVNIFENFLKRHPQIECLKTSVVPSDPDDLANVRALGLPFLPSYLTTEKEKDVLCRLEYMSLKEPPQESVICLASLRVLVVASHWDRLYHIATLPSTLERLCIIIERLRYDPKDAGKDFIGILERKSNLKSLTHLCISISPALSPTFQTWGFLRRLTRILPSLKYFGLAWYNGRESWIRICRNGKGRYMGHELDDTVEEVEEWAFSSFIS